MLPSAVWHCSISDLWLNDGEHESTAWKIWRIRSFDCVILAFLKVMGANSPANVNDIYMDKIVWSCVSHSKLSTHPTALVRSEFVSADRSDINAVVESSPGSTVVYRGVNPLLERTASSPVVNMTVTSRSDYPMVSSQFWGHTFQTPCKQSWCTLGHCILIFKR